MTSENYPLIRKGGSLLLAWRLKDRKVLIVGGGEVAASRVIKALEADSLVILVCPEHELKDELKYRIQQGQIHKWINRGFEASDLNGVDMVLSAIDDPERSREIFQLCRERRIPVNVADVPPLCDFYFMSEHREGPLQIAVSTNGQGPKLANIIRRHIADNLPHGIGDAIKAVGSLRQKVKHADPDHTSSAKRMNWMSRICEEWSLEELQQLDDEKIENLMSHYVNNEVPQLSKVLSEISLGKNHAENNNTDSESCKNDDLQIKNAKEQLPTEILTTNNKKKARIILVGAGPGDPELLTHKATKAISSADIIVSDRLIPQAVFENITCEIRFAPAKSGAIKSLNSQELLQNWCLEALNEGKTVVRLKIGDPFLFGRGGEEVTFFREKGWDVEVIPGISCILSAPMVADVPVTHRGLSDQVLVTTGQGTNGRLPDLPPYNAMRTTVVLMAVGKANDLSKELLEKGYPPDLPAVFVENSNCPNQRIIKATVSTLGEVVEREHVVAPSTIVIGRAVNREEQKWV
ncbi:4950_t:CDS:1 [Acaulospora morrowiae]|uniref:precorrin-2 dehydrogenase n=1 Tax=Acaulospora morrowiae TaxID=94023 RepID=A0A9N9EIK7_9GLOM|nr:4950_t:CDS:1 [Acaulospora morrowiae]